MQKKETQLFLRLEIRKILTLSIDQWFLVKKELEARNDTHLSTLAARIASKINKNENIVNSIFNA